MPNCRHLVPLTFLLGCVISAFADGKFYATRENVPPGVPYQRALLMFDEGKETLVLQSRFRQEDRPYSEPALGWVVPVPGVPDLASLTSEQAADLFWSLDLRSGPSETRIPVWLILWLLPLILLIAIYRRKRFPTLFLILGIVFWFLFAVSNYLFLGIRTAPRSGVSVLKEQRVGIYQAKVITAADSSGLIAWLNDNRFRFQTSDQPVLDDYLERGWVFVVATVRPEERTSPPDFFEGMPDSLILRFASKTPVYPLALTGTVGSSTEILLYVWGRGKMQCPPPLELRFAGKIDRVPDEFPLQAWESSLSYLCKFKGTLTPAQMRKDLELEPAPDNAQFRERYVFWW